MQFIRSENTGRLRDEKKKMSERRKLKKTDCAIRLCIIFNSYTTLRNIILCFSSTLLQLGEIRKDKGWSCSSKPLTSCSSNQIRIEAVY